MWTLALPTYQDKGAAEGTEPAGSCTQLISRYTGKMASLTLLYLSALHTLRLPEKQGYPMRVTMGTGLGPHRNKETPSARCS